VGNINTAFDLYMGGTTSPNTPVDFFNGVIDQTRIYSKALSDSEIQGLFNESANPVSNGNNTQFDISSQHNTNSISDCYNYGPTYYNTIQGSANTIIYQTYNAYCEGRILRTDISSIPTNATINSVSFQYNVTSIVGTPPPCALVDIMDDPLSASSATIWGDMYGGINGVTNSNRASHISVSSDAQCTTVGNHHVDTLNSQGIADLTNQVRNGKHFFAIAMTYGTTAVNSQVAYPVINGFQMQVTYSTAPSSTPPSSPQNLSTTAVSSSQINLSWSAPSNNGGSPITGYKIERSTDSGSTWSTSVSNTGSASTRYNDTGLSPSTTYTYRVSAINSAGTSSPSNVSSATTGTVSSSGIALSNIQSTSGSVSSSNQITLANFNAGTGNNRLLVVGISTNNNDVASVTFGGVQLTQAVKSFYNNDAEFWYLKNPAGTGNIVVTTSGPTSAVVGAYSLSGVDQTSPIPTSTTKHNTTPNSPNISITTKFANDWILDLPSIYGGSTLGSPTCTQQWDVNIQDTITGASSSKMVPTLGAVTCNWTASSADLWDDVAVEIKASP